MYQLEALASGIPLVQPSVGAFPEIIEATGGDEIWDDENTKSRHLWPGISIGRKKGEKGADEAINQIRI